MYQGFVDNLCRTNQDFLGQMATPSLLWDSETKCQKYLYFGFNNTWLEKGHNLVTESQIKVNASNNSSVGRMGDGNMGVEALRYPWKLQQGQECFMHCGCDMSHCCLWCKDPSARLNGGLGCTNNYIKHDNTELCLSRTLSSHCNIHIDYLSHISSISGQVFTVILIYIKTRGTSCNPGKKGASLYLS